MERHRHIKKQLKEVQQKTFSDLTNKRKRIVDGLRLQPTFETLNNAEGIINQQIIQNALNQYKESQQVPFLNYDQFLQGNKTYYDQKVKELTQRNFDLSVDQAKKIMGEQKKDQEVYEELVKNINENLKEDEYWGQIMKREEQLREELEKEEIKEEIKEEDIEKKQEELEMLRQKLERREQLKNMVFIQPSSYGKLLKNKEFRDNPEFQYIDFDMDENRKPQYIFEDESLRDIEDWPIPLIEKYLIFLAKAKISNQEIKKIKNILESKKLSEVEVKHSPLTTKKKKTPIKTISLKKK